MSELDAFEEWLYEAIRGMHLTPDGTDYVSLRSLAEDAWLAYRRHGTPLPTFGPPVPDVPGDDEPFVVGVDPVIVGERPYRTSLDEGRWRARTARTRSCRSTHRSPVLCSD